MKDEDKENSSGGTAVGISIKNKRAAGSEPVDIGSGTSQEGESSGDKSNNRGDAPKSGFSFSIHSIGDPSKKKPKPFSGDAVSAESGVDNKGKQNGNDGKKEEGDKADDEFDWSTICGFGNALTLEDVGSLCSIIDEMHKKTLEMRTVAGKTKSVFDTPFFNKVAEEYVQEKEGEIAEIVLGDLWKADDPMQTSVSEIYKEELLLKKIKDGVSLLRSPIKTDPVNGKATLIEDDEVIDIIFGKSAKVFDVDVGHLVSELRHSETILHPSMWYLCGILSLGGEKRLADKLQDEYKVEMLTKLFSEDVLNVFSFS